MPLNVRVPAPILVNAMVVVVAPDVAPLSRLPLITVLPEPPIASVLVPAVPEPAEGPP